MEHLQRSLDYIEENLGAELTVRELAELAGYSVSHFSHLFRETTGMSVGHCILRRRLLHAGWEMSRGGSFIDTALRWGFDTYAVLSETFPREPERWLECWRGLMEGYAPTGAERKAAPLVLLGSQMVCVAWYAEQEKYRALFQTNQKMTLWLLEHFQSCEPKRLPCAKGVGELSALLTEGAFTEATKSAYAGDRKYRSRTAAPCRPYPFRRCTGKWG